MAETHVISALVKKRSELLGELQYYEQIIKEYKANLATIDNTILIFDEDYDLLSVKPIKKQRNKYFENGEAKTMVLDLLRKKKIPLKTDEIGSALASIKNVDISVERVRKNFNKSIVSNLSILEKQDLVERVGKDGLIIKWQIKQVA